MALDCSACTSGFSEFVIKRSYSVGVVVTFFLFSFSSQVVQSLFDDSRGVHPPLSLHSSPPHSDSSPYLSLGHGDFLFLDNLVKVEVDVRDETRDDAHVAQGPRGRRRRTKR